MSSTPHHTLIASHRGGSYLWPENSLTAFRRTAELPVDQVEFDVHLSADDAVVVIHDATLDRTTETRGQVRARTLAELRQIRLRGADGESVPTLAEVAAVYRDTPIALRVEIKPDVDRLLYPGIAPKVVAELEAAGMLERSVITSFQAPMLEEVRATGRFPGKMIWLCTPATWCDIGLAGVLGVARGCGASGIALHHSIWTPMILAEARGAGLSPGAWGLRDDADIRRVLDLGLDIFTSDEPVAALRLRG